MIFVESQPEAHRSSVWLRFREPSRGDGRADASVELTFHPSATRAELIPAETGWHVAFVMLNSVPTNLEFSSDYDVGDGGDRPL